jgi:hypothetical protein
MMMMTEEQIKAAIMWRQSRFIRFRRWLASRRCRLSSVSTDRADTPQTRRRFTR